MSDTPSNDNKDEKKDENHRHKARMQQQKAKVDERIANAQVEKGVLIVITGNGKGKSTSGFGTVARAVGHGLKACVVQYVKGTWPCGERDLLEKLGVEFHVMGTGFTWETQDKETDKAAAQKAWEFSKTCLQDPSIDLLLLDEITYMLTYKYIDLDDVLAALENRPANQHVVITGRACHRAVIELADTVSEVRPIKHAFEAGIKAQKGIDW
ncbi:cob(I)yrinic acid a,c-diamide adenosyltransferase [Paraglaciecola sp. T6c]|uniref:cob(I)yrinic acid a,c-diamide adenosyltransferase n=1 Tax=Pseudoalteromonas atlantica (strain T6c / ATCC BAA-1087) TaxID=3042615 RepID=UPI00005C735B|nr:cob(I)yrinic acid a,c-diamide adenosyltransferase [Paraglaciecola sp. T6c]ABG39660.1 cob(I)yrinic acid a,c-diamide adenosyltransferase [Paraglaciecola sp. T6c]